MDKNNVIDYIFESVERNKKAQKEYSFGNGYAFMKDPLPDDIDLEQVLVTVEENVPFHLRQEVDTVFVGDFDELRKRHVNALFKDGAIYITNQQSTHDDMVDDIVHEIGHSVEEVYGYEIYSDNKVVNEFRQKREKLRQLLKAEGRPTQGYDFKDVEYKLEFDDYLFQVIGYPTLESLCMGLFSNAYAPTSIREYFSSGFEAYFLGDRDYLRKVSPVLYTKIKEIVQND
jgi:hypothetical protein